MFREEHRLRLFENRVLRIIFGPSEGRGNRTVLDYLYSPQNTFRFFKSRRMRLAGYIERKGDIRGAYRVLVEKPVERIEVKRALKRCRCRWKD
jgi:hypothetical protein